MQQGFRISDWHVEPQLNTLTGPDKTAHLEPKVMQVLLCLAEQPGQVIPKERLIQRVWPDTFVSDDVLTRSISELRRAFGDDAKEPRFIQTIPRSGYRLIARVFSTDAERGIAAPEHVATNESVDESRARSLIVPVNGGSAASGLGIAAALERSKSSFLRPWVAIAFLSPIVMAFLVWTLWQYPARRTEVLERKLTGNSSENSVTSMAISPDGRHLAYADNTGIFLKLIHTGEIHPVTLPPNFSAGVDDWFPDGSHLLVSRAEQPGKVSLWSISVFGGAPRQLADDASGGSLSPDGSHVAFRRGDLTHDGLWGREEWVMRSDGTDLVKVAAGKSDASEVGAPTWSPDGKRIAYIRSNWAYNARTSSVEVNEWQNATAETLFSDRRLSPALHWLPDGRLIYAFGSAQHQQESSLWVVSLEQSRKLSSPPKRLTGGHGWISQIAGSADGKIVIFLRGNWLPSVYIGTLAADATHLLMKKRLTLDENENIPSCWTPDSKAVLFSSDRNGNREIFKQAIDQPLAETLVTSADQVSQPVVTPDGSEILYISTPKSASSETPSSLFAIPIGGGTPRLVLKAAGIWNVQCARLPSTICLYGIARGSTWEAFQFDVRTGKSTAPQIDPPVNWSLSPDGSERAIIVFGPNIGKIQFRSTSTSKTRDLVLKGWNGLMGVSWSADGRRLLVSWHSFQQDSALLSVTLDGKASVLLNSHNSEIWHAIPSPNGRLLAIAEARGPKNVWQIENF